MAEYYVVTDGDIVPFSTLSAAWRYYWGYCQAYAPSSATMPTARS